MGHTVPVEYLLLLLRADAVVFVHKVKERTLGLFEGRICARFEVAQIREDALFEFLRVLDWSPKRLEPEGQASYDVSTRNVK